MNSWTRACGGFATRMPGKRNAASLVTEVACRMKVFVANVLHHSRKYIDCVACYPGANIQPLPAQFVEKLCSKQQVKLDNKLKPDNPSSERTATLEKVI